MIVSDAVELVLSEQVSLELAQEINGRDVGS